MILFFGDNDYEFDLGAIKNITELETICDASIGRIFAHVRSPDDVKAKFVLETIRLAAIGGGMAPVTAKLLVEQYVDRAPLDRPDDPASPVKTAMAILAERIYGLSQIQTNDEDQPPGKPEAAATDVSTPPHSTLSEPTPSTGPQNKSEE